jgi:hypothetical protein
MSDEVAIVILGLVFVTWRLDRLGKQLEAVCTNIKVELTPDDDRKRELIKEWKENTGRQSKDARQSFIFWALVIGGAMAWWFIRHPMG